MSALKILVVFSKILEWGQRQTFLSKKIWRLPIVAVRNVASLKSLSLSERQVFKEALVDLGLGLENRMKTDANFLSGGQRQALTLAMATLVRPKILLLDEHTAALDPKTSDMVMNLTRKIVEEQIRQTLMITHNMEHAIEYGNLVMLYHGKIVVDVRGEEREISLLQNLWTSSTKIVEKSSMTIPWCSVNKQKRSFLKFRFWVVFLDYF